MTGPRTVRIAVVGDADTGKTSLISAAANDTFVARPVPVLPPTRLPQNFVPEPNPILLTDTSAKPEDGKALDYAVQHSDAVVVCFDPKRAATLDSVRTVWYPRIQKLNPDIPIILACCKADRLSDRDQPNVRERVERVARDLPNVECCLNCSSKFNKMVHDVFYYALKAVLYPLQPVYDRTDRVMKQAAVRALKRVFIMCDVDKDGYLNDQEINHFQQTCFGISLSPEELRGIKQVVRAQVVNGFSDAGLTLEGFLFLQGLFIERGRLETVWQVLRRFGYNDQLRLSDDLLDKVQWAGLNTHQVWELSPAALEFLAQQFNLYDARGENMLTWEQLQGLFSTAPSLPMEWQNERVNRLMVCGTFGSTHSLPAFLARWRYCALSDPRATLAHLLYLGWDGQGGPAALLERRTRRRPDKRHKEEMAARTTLTCYVMGSSGCGKSTLLRALAGRRPDDAAGGSGAGGAGGVGRGGAQPLTALANVRGDDDVERALALVEVPEDVLQEYLTTTSLAGAAGPPGRGAGVVVMPAAAATAAHNGIAGALAPPSAAAAAPPGGDAASPSSSAAAAGAAAPPQGGTSASASGSLLPDLSRCDLAVFVFDSSSEASWRWAHQQMVALCSLPGCETLPCVLVASKDDVGMNGTLRAEVAAASGQLALPEPVAVAADSQQLSSLFRYLVSAAVLQPELHIPDTPVRKARRRLQRQLLYGGLAVAGLVTTGLVVYSLTHGDDSTPSPGAGSGSAGRYGSSGTSAGSRGALASGPVGGGKAPDALFGVPTLGDKLKSFFS